MSHTVHTIRLHRVLKAPPQRVYQAFTTAAALAKWLPPHGYICEVPEFDEAVANNELVAPPAGAIVRGDAFVLAVANRVNAVVLSNDSFQEFHGTYAWLFDEGRLVGGKPVPHVGWVFLPVRGAVSRSAVKQSRRKRDEATAGTVRVGSPEASQPMPVPTAPPPGPAAVASAEKATEKPAGGGRRRGGRGGKAAEVVVAPAPAPSPALALAVGTRTVNEADVFLTFVAEHPLGTSVNAVVESYSSHGAYVNIGEVRGYVPLRLMADPAPRSAREFMKIGDAVTLVVESYSPERRSVDLALAAMATHRAPAEVAPAKRPRRTKAAVEAAAAAEQAPVVEVPVVEDPVAEVPAKAAKPSRRKAKPAEPVAEPVTAPVEVVVEAAPAKQPARRKKAAAPAPEPEPEVPAAPAPAPRARKKAAAPAAPVEPAVEPAAPAKPRRRAKA